MTVMLPFPAFQLGIVLPITAYRAEVLNLRGKEVKPVLNAGRQVMVLFLCLLAVCDGPRHEYYTKKLYNVKVRIFQVGTKIPSILHSSLISPHHY
ncbi:hypothetical protein [Geobacter sp. FeAm09]|uniref:hypothetical protein n=1 Tax=Geobacter sp. FeAm09 TaxID=2597769 RepID=UPI00197AF8F9|nr:hypothetical protein [Geobacter sp. FeAm09]